MSYFSFFFAILRWYDQYTYVVLKVKDSWIYSYNKLGVYGSSGINAGTKLYKKGDINVIFIMIINMSIG